MSTQPKPSYIITDDKRFFTVRLAGKPIATITRPRVLDYNGKWTLTDTQGRMIASWPYRPRRSEVNANLARIGLWNDRG